VLGSSAIHNSKDYKRASAVMNQLLDEIGEDEHPPLADVLDYLANQIVVYEAEHTNIPDAEPREVLRFLMEQQGSTQSDLADCAPQSRVSEILNGLREISNEIAKALALKFEVNVGLFV
jgi:HTH-type transcriptional regulator / antitoxin HigA